VKGGVQDLEKRLSQAAGDADRLSALLELGALHAAEHRDREGLRAAREALALAQAGGFALAAAQALALACRCHHQRGDHFAAVASGMDALQAFGQEDSRGRSDTLRAITLALLAVEDFQHAHWAAEGAVAAAAGDHGAEADAHAAFGRVLAAGGRGHAARQELRRAGELYRGLGDRVGLKRITAAVARSYRNQAEVAQRAGLVEQARLQWRHAARVYRIALAFGDRAADDASILCGIAECEVWLDDIDAAYEHATRALSLAEEAAAGATIGLARLLESQALHAMSRLPAAERACAHALAAAEQARDEPLLIACLHELARVSDQLGRFESAADFEERAIRVASQRTALLARMRAELAPLWDRLARPPGTVVPINSRA
jgi:tetratricopeptide (TPR) repeat protein